MALLKIDPVCGMTVDPESATLKAEHGGQTYYFCSAGCRTKFTANPAKYLDPELIRAAADAQPKDAIYTCPMHPEIRQVGPGSCPICGMALEPLVATAESGPNPRIVDMTRRFWIGLALAVPVFALEMGGHLTGLHMLLGTQLSNWIQLALATPVVLWAGWPFFERGWDSLKTRNLNMFTLIAMGTGVAWVYSVVATVVSADLPAGLPAAGWLGRGLFRSRGGDHRTGAAGPGTGTACAGADVRRDQGAAWSCAQDGTAHQCRWCGRRCRNRCHCVSATSCACALAKKCPSTVSLSKAERRSTSRW